ncbi:MAG TPA: Clp protease N-terminal domain-containing protein [Blastocatellia bacterium]|nr:Clp protease N-terminal domain-containing protein [Blastocatellia bacterium]
MFERYTENARRVIFFARYEASQFGASQIEAEHILLGLIRQNKKLIARVFHHAGADFESVRDEIEGRTVARERISSQIDLPLSAEAKQALAFAADESETLGDRHIGSEHLLLGLLRAEDSIAAEVLSMRGLSLSNVRQYLARPVSVESVTQKLSLDAPVPVDRDVHWMKELSEACIDAGLFTEDELSAEFENVATLRQFGADTEALLRTLAAKGLVDPQNLPHLAFDLRDDKNLAEFIEKLRHE